MFLCMKNPQGTLSQAELLLLCNVTRLVKEEFFILKIQQIFFPPIVLLQCKHLLSNLTLMVFLGEMVKKANQFILLL